MMTIKEMMECVILAMLLVGCIGSTYMLIELLIDSFKNMFQEEHEVYINII